jgi:protein-arginine kinase activator protein McsA
MSQHRVCRCGINFDVEASPISRLLRRESEQLGLPVPGLYGLCYRCQWDAIEQAADHAGQLCPACKRPYDELLRCKRCGLDGCADCYHKGLCQGCRMDGALSDPGQGANGA